MGEKAMNRRGFLGGVVKLGAGAAALSALAACDALHPSNGLVHGEPGFCDKDKKRRKVDKRTTDKRVGHPNELFQPLTLGTVMEKKWRFESVQRRPDSHLRVHLVDVTTDNSLQIEMFRAVAGNGKAIAETDLWEFYTFTSNTRGKETPDHVKDAVNQLAMRLLDNEFKAPLVNLNGTVCTFAEHMQAVVPSTTTPRFSRAGS